LSLAGVLSNQYTGFLFCYNTQNIKEGWMARRKVFFDQYIYKQCLIAIRKIARGRKPFAEVAGLRMKKSDLEFVLSICLRRTGQTGKVFYWIRYSGKRWRGLYRWKFGFYRQPWTLTAFDFLNCTKLSHFDLDWIQGLFFGYSPKRIQAFLDRQKSLQE
jgi:hypothetical protein